MFSHFFFSILIVNRIFASYDNNNLKSSFNSNNIMEDKHSKEKINRVKSLEDSYFENSQVSKNDVKTKKAFYMWIDAVIQLFSDFYSDDNEILKLIKNENCADDGYRMNDLFYRIRNKYSSMLFDIESGRVKINRIDNEQAQHNMNKINHPIVFISHASVDKEVIREFIDNILKNGLGLSDENIVCTSFEWTTVPLGEDITEYIHNKIEKSNVVLTMVSQDYKKSEVCLNEVGAAWALKKRIISIVLPDSDFKQLGWLFNLDKAIKIDDEDSLNHLQRDLCDCLNLQPKLSLNWKPCVSRFLDYFKNILPTKTKTYSVTQATMNAASNGINHDKTLFESFNNRFPEKKIKYSFHMVQTTTKFSDYDLTIWFDMINWFGEVSNSFLDKDLQNAAQKYLNNLNSLVEFTGKYYSPDYHNWNKQNDYDVSQEKWREIHESRIYTWEPEHYDESYRQLERTIISEIDKTISNVEKAYKQFRLCVKSVLFV